MYKGHYWVVETSENLTIVSKEESLHGFLTLIIEALELKYIPMKSYKLFSISYLFRMQPPANWMVTIFLGVFLVARNFENASFILSLEFIKWKWACSCVPLTCLISSILRQKLQIKHVAPHPRVKTAAFNWDQPTHHSLRFFQWYIAIYN